MKKNICVIGGGNLAHVCMGVLSNDSNISVSLLTNHPERWNHTYDVYTPNGAVINANISKFSSDPTDVIPLADIVLLCLPAYCVESTIVKIKPYLNAKTIVGSIVGNSGFFIFCHKHLPSTTPLFAFQRVPYVARVIEYGKSANLLGYRDELFVAMENVSDVEGFRCFLETVFNEKTTLVNSFYEVTLSNSNPILHTGRLYTMWKDWDGKPFDRCSLFYKEWTDECSALEIEMDKEFFCLLSCLGVDTTHIETLLQHYESTNAQEMTAKIKSIDSLSTIKSPMTKIRSGWVPDYSSRYFIEDFPYGLKLIIDVANKYDVDVPHLREVLDWGMNII